MTRTTNPNETRRPEAGHPLRQLWLRTPLAVLLSALGRRA